MLCFDHVSFAYPGERTILNDLTFSVSEGEQVGLIGAGDEPRQPRGYPPAAGLCPAGFGQPDVHADGV